MRGKGNQTIVQLAQRWRELEECGIPLEPLEYRAGIDDRNPGRGLVIEQEIDYGSQVIMPLSDGRTRYILKAFILDDLPGKTYIRDFWLEVPGGDPSIEWLPDPAEQEFDTAAYTFSRHGWLYPRKDVLNHQMKGTLKRGDTRRGLLLAVGLKPPPETWAHGDRVTTTLKVTDQWGDTHFGVFEMYIQWPAKAKNSRRAARSTSRMLQTTPG